jgi:murein DD-endopeptidase MepM/ murein hydrolase activator NlpD
MRLRLLFLVATVPLVLWAVLPLPTSGAPSQRKVDQLQRQIDAKRRQVERKRARERLLSGDIASYSRRIRSLQSDITTLQSRQVRLQAQLDRARAELARIQERLRQERLRLARLRARLAEAKRTLSVRMVELYKADEPDVVTVILQADGFADLVQRTEFMERVSAQDRRIILRVKEAKREATATEKRLDALEARQREVAAIILRKRDEVAAIRGRLVERRDDFSTARAAKARVLTSTRADRHSLEAHMRSLQAESARISSQLRALAARAASNRGGGGGGTLPAGPIRSGSGSMIWPTNGTLTSGFGMRWGRLHAGIDIAAPIGTAIRAADSGRVALAGWTGGYGNYTCIQHSGSLATCYGHQSSIGVSVGQGVSKGQVIGAVGNTGNSTGPHLHFEVRINGSPVNPAGYL